MSTTETNIKSNIIYNYRLYTLLLLFVACILQAACSHIMLQPKDNDLVIIENFARDVTVHLFELNPISYVKFQKALDSEISPELLLQLKQKGICPSSVKQSQENLRMMALNHKRCLIHIDSFGFPGKASAQGLIPVEVDGTCVKTMNDISKTSKFEILYWVGYKTGTKEPMIAQIQIKKFD